MGLAEAQQLYDSGDHKQAMALARTLGDDVEVLSLVAWCHYKLKEYEQAARLAESLETEKAIVCMATILAYVAEFRDDKCLLDLWKKHPFKGVANAVIVRARSIEENDDFFERVQEEAHHAFIKFEHRQRALEDLDGHLHHNFGRLVLRDKDFAQGISRLLHAALIYRQAGASSDHIAAAYHHASQACTGKFPSEELRFQQLSFQAWQQAVANAPGNEHFESCHEKARNRFQHLLRSQG